MLALANQSAVPPGLACQERAAREAKHCNRQFLDLLSEMLISAGGFLVSHGLKSVWVLGFQTPLLWRTWIVLVIIPEWDISCT